MPIDASIPLQVQQFKLPSALEVMSLKDLAVRSQINEVDLQTKKNALASQQAISGIMEKYKGGNVPLSQVAGEIATVPFGGMEAAKRLMDFDKEQEAINVAKKTNQQKEAMQEVGQYLADVQRLRMQGAKDDQIKQQANQLMMGREDQRRKAGQASVFSNQERDNLLRYMSQQDITEMESHYRGLGGDIPGETPFTKELAAAGIRPGTPEFDKAMKAKIAKDVAPSATTLMMSGQMDMPPETAQFVAQQYLAGDKGAAQGYARNARARIQIANAIVNEAKLQGMDAKDAANAAAEFSGYTAGQRTLGTRQAQIDLAANVVEQFIPIAKAASDAYQRTGIKSINDLQKAVQSQTASPELRRLNASVNAVVNAYARAVNPTGVGNEADKVEARKLLDAGFATGDFNAAADQILMEINAEKKAPGKVKGEMREFFTGKKTEEKQGGPYSDAEKERRYQEWKKAHGG
jgi:hypothetical protein